MRNFVGFWMFLEYGWLVLRTSGDVMDEDRSFLAETEGLETLSGFYNSFDNTCPGVHFSKTWVLEASQSVL